MPEVVELAKKEWEQAGVQYLAENEEQFKSQIDFLHDTLNHAELQGISIYEASAFGEPRKSLTHYSK